MYARKRIDIGWLDLAAGIAACARPVDRAATAARIERRFAHGAGALCCLSVRSGFDQYLGCLALPAGSEVLVSALTIPDMWRILERHELVPVPVDLDPETLAPRPEALLGAATPRTRAVLVAHLFGARLDLAPIAALAAERGWLVIEDCAQAFAGDGFAGSPGADVSMFSFGPIKTSTALAGGVLRVRDAQILARMRAAHARLPVAPRGAFLRRVLKYSGLKLLSGRPLYALLARGSALAGRDLDGVVGSLTRGFAGGDLFAKIRRQPCGPLLALLERRLARFDERRLARRERLARRLAAGLPAAFTVPGLRAPGHSFWVFPLVAEDPARLVAGLRQAGFDATSLASLAVVPAPRARAGREPATAADLNEHIVYLPVYPDLDDQGLERLAHAVRRCAPGAEGVAEIRPFPRRAAPAPHRRWAEALLRHRAR